MCFKANKYLQNFLYELYAQNYLRMAPGHVTNRKPVTSTAQLVHNRIPQREIRLHPLQQNYHSI